MEGKITVIDDRYKILRGLNAGGFGKTYIALDGDKQIAVKVEEVVGKRLQLLANEYVVYLKLRGVDGFPRVRSYTARDTHNVLAMDLLGPNLEEVFAFCNHRLTCKTVVMIVDQVLERLESLHKMNFIHRDVKPENFLLGIGRNVHRVYAVDLGLVKSYRYDCILKEVPIVEEKVTRMIGTPRYASVSAHLGKDQYKADDLESLSYMLIYLYTGFLPWERVKNKDKGERFYEICEMKRTIKIDELCKGCPEQFKMFVEYCRKLKRFDEPDYRYLHYLLWSWMKSYKQVFDYDYDWHMIFHYPVDRYYGSMNLIYNFFPKGKRLPLETDEDRVRKTLAEFIVNQRDREALMHCVPFKKLERYNVEVETIREKREYNKVSVSFFENIENQLIVYRNAAKVAVNKTGTKKQRRSENRDPQKGCNENCKDSHDNLKAKRCESQDEDQHEKKSEGQYTEQSEQEDDSEMKARMQKEREEQKKWLEREKTRQLKLKQEQEMQQKKLEESMTAKELKAFKKQQEQEEHNRQLEQWLRIEAKEKERIRLEREEQQRRKQEEKERLRLEHEREKEEVRLRREYEKTLRKRQKEHAKRRREKEREDLRQAEEQHRLKQEQHERRNKRAQVIERLTHDLRNGSKHAPYRSLDHEELEQLKQLKEEERQERLEEETRQKCHRERKETFKRERFLWAHREKEQQCERLEQDYENFKRDHKKEDESQRVKLEKLQKTRSREKLELEQLRKKIEVATQEVNEAKQNHEHGYVSWERDQQQLNTNEVREIKQEIEQAEKLWNQHHKNSTPESHKSSHKRESREKLKQREKHDRCEAENSQIPVPAFPRRSMRNTHSQSRHSRRFKRNVLTCDIDDCDLDADMQLHGFSKVRTYVQGLLGKIVGGK